ncbi:uncharacterized protein LOC133806626 [Humulus lupulus]|uniref:uncharacterized protein LOC133806626 n=1 Tax=Humulus lupulus TaxID=3486 RepID=UPI002B416526|nr:uncharacterized protein LOC133806626 [Humulus lupulus]
MPRVEKEDQESMAMKLLSVQNSPVECEFYVCKWDKQVWGRLNVPKHSFILWMAIQDKLKTKVRLFKFKVIDEEVCGLCNIHKENVEHLFFHCSFSHVCLQVLKTWLGWNVRAEDLQSLIRWIERSKQSQFKKKVLAAALVYHLWRARNDEVLKISSSSQEVIIRRTKEAVKLRVSCAMPRKVSSEDKNWFAEL